MNVYGPCELARKKKELWKEIVSLEQQRGGQMWYIVRDFNDVKCEDERKGGLEHSRQEEIQAFEELMEEAKAMNSSMVGMRFTCYRDDGTTKSRHLSHFFHKLSTILLDMWTILPP